MSLITSAAFVRFYLPLAATSLLLTATNPILAAALARSEDPTAALAGYSVAFALCGVLYSPLLVVQQVAAQRLLGAGRFSTVTRFAYLVGASCSAVGAVIAFSSVGPLVFNGVVGVDGKILDEALRAMGLLWPVPFLTAVRAAHQGRLVAGHRTRPIAVATGMRTGILGLVAFALATTGGGAWLGAAAFTFGLVVETVMVMAARTPALELEPEACAFEGEGVARFSAPLMLNVILWWATPLIINSVLARTATPDTTLAAFAVVEAVAWFMTAPVGQLQHASIALVDCRETHTRIRSWAVLLAIGTAAVLGLLSLPLVREPVLGAVFGLDAMLVASAGAALPVAALYPLLYGHRQYYQGLYVRAGRTSYVGMGAVLRVGSLLAVAIFTLPRWGYLGAGFGVALAVFGMAVEGLFLERLSHRRALPALSRRAPLPAEVLETTAEV